MVNIPSLKTSHRWEMWKSPSPSDWGPGAPIARRGPYRRFGDWGPDRLGSNRLEPPCPPPWWICILAAAPLLPPQCHPHRRGASRSWVREVSQRAVLRVALNSLLQLTITTLARAPLSLMPTGPSWSWTFLERYTDWQEKSVHISNNAIFATGKLAPKSL